MRQTNKQLINTLLYCFIVLLFYRSFHWTYVSVVYSDTDYGNKGYEQLQELAHYHNICFSNPQSINIDMFKEEDYDLVIKNLMHKINARG